MAMAQVVRMDDQMPKTFTWTETLGYHFFGVVPDSYHTPYGCRASAWPIDRLGQRIEAKTDRVVVHAEGTLKNHHFFKDANGVPWFDPTMFEREELEPQSHEFQDLTSRFSSFSFSRGLAEGCVLYRSQRPGVYSVLHQRNGDVHFVEWEDGKVLTSLIGPDIVDVHVHAQKYASFCAALVTRVAKAEEVKKSLTETRGHVSPKEKARMKRFITQLAAVAFPTWRIKEWRSSNYLCELLKSPTMDLKTYRSELEKMWGKEFFSFIDQYVALIKIEVNASNPAKNPSPEQKPRIYISVREQAIIASLLMIECFEDIWFGHDHHEFKPDMENAWTGITQGYDPWGPRSTGMDNASQYFCMPNHIKNVRREVALRNMIERSRKSRLPRATFGIEVACGASETLVLTA